MSRRQPRRGAGKSSRGEASPAAAVARLAAELAEARARLEQVERHGIEAATARRLAALEEGQQVARGQAVDAALARSRAEAELRRLREAIGAAPGLRGWLLRRAARGLEGEP